VEKNLILFHACPFPHSRESRTSHKTVLRLVYRIHMRAGLHATPGNAPIGPAGRLPSSSPPPRSWRSGAHRHRNFACGRPMRSTPASRSGAREAICAASERTRGDLCRARVHEGRSAPRPGARGAICATAWHRYGVAYPEKRLQPRCRARFPRSRDSPPPRAGTQVAIRAIAWHENGVAYPGMRSEVRNRGRGGTRAALKPRLPGGASAAPTVAGGDGETSSVALRPRPAAVGRSAERKAGQAHYV